ncbi:UDP-N-acetylglucosamine--N-acetylmuramyl-(pentapeptide) pyrophosphoryl-undecaprenol N-acetylglucosamine transferase [candidate division WOR-3 bacterium]|nr:UDP-N-acetylglucosamine--N-acetylmuramyl-(pentapeptide) pyrophosphoryl-undecaprenol N-acetylglucosamine transferase [candidate division WOR-3 bacterium]
MRFLVAAGGTGGHILPALALASELMKAGHDLCWLGRADGMEADLVKRAGFRFTPVPAARLPGRRLHRAPGWLAATLRGVAVSGAAIRDERADALVAAGGYVSVGPLVAARLQRLPYFLLEQNRRPGRVTRMFAPGARRVFCGFPPEPGLRADVEVTGNPLRPGPAAGQRADDGRTVLVLGGSLGARALSLAALDAAAALTNLRFTILTGHRDYALVKSRVRSANCELVEFTDRPEELYRQATIAVSRAGGMVLSELVASGIPAILVPYPHATDRHQDANAEWLASNGAAITLDQARLSGLTVTIRGLIDDDERRSRMSAAARRLALPGAGAAIAERMGECLAA